MHCAQLSTVAQLLGVADLGQHLIILGSSMERRYASATAVPPAAPLTVGQPPYGTGRAAGGRPLAAAVVALRTS